MILIRRYNGLFAVNESGRFIGKIINEASGDCCDSPEPATPEVFSRLFGGNGCVYHQQDNPPNSSFNRNWSEVFVNSDLLPSGTKNVFVDQSKDAEDDFIAVEQATQENKSMTEPKFQIGQRVKVQPLDLTTEKKDWLQGELVNYTLHTPPCYVVALDCGVYAHKVEGLVFNGCDLETI